MKCPVCESNMTALSCSCGYDASRCQSCGWTPDPKPHIGCNVSQTFSKSSENFFN